MKRRRELIRAQLMDTPELSDRQIAKRLGVDHKTVSAAREQAEGTGEIPQLDSCLGADGKVRPRQRAYRIKDPGNEDAILASAKAITGNRGDSALHRAPGVLPGGGSLTEDNMSNEMTKAERLELGKLVRLRASVAKADVAQMEARRLADVEAQLAAKYSAIDSAWAEITASAKQAVAKADAEIAERCRELGIPEKLRPSLHLGWYERGDNAVKTRRAELRKVAQTELTAQGKAAKVKIDRQTAALLTQLVSGALGSSEAKAFLEAMPSIDELMPRITLPELEKSLDRQQHGYFPFPTSA
jgi:hypothetical protein